MKKTALLMFILVYGQIHICSAQQFDFNIFSIYGNHLPDADARSAREEKQIIQTVLIDTFSHLSPELRDVASQISYVVDHDVNITNTKVVMGFSAEDDVQYKYPDRTFYHPSANQNGTIKIIFKEKFVQACDFLLQLTEQNTDRPDIVEAAEGFYRSIIEHELMHASQYQSNPVPDLDRNMNFVEKGELTVDQLIEGTRKKVENERTAYLLTMSHVKPGRLETLAQATEKFMKQHAEEFVINGRYSLLANDKPSPFVSRYLREADSNVNYYYANKKQPKTWNLIYEGQIRPVEIAEEMKKITSGKSKLSRRELKKLKKLDTELKSFESEPFWNDVTVKQHAYLKSFIDLAQAITSSYSIE